MVLTPDQVEDKKAEIIPNEVFEVFDELIAENWNGSSSTFQLDAVRARVKKKLGEGVPGNFLDIKSIYRKAGWSVKYDSPGYNENYSATYQFRKP